MKANQAEFTPRAMARVLGVSKSGYYAWLTRPVSHRAQSNIVLTKQIQEIHQMSDTTYGMPRIHAELQEQGIKASPNRIARLMRAAQLRGVSRRQFVVTTQRNPKDQPAPDLVKRQFTADKPNQLWVADMTYVPTWEGFLYLAVVTDVFSRKVVGWAFGIKMTSDLVVRALNMAILTRKPASVIHHSDQGSQYTSVAFTQCCKNAGVVSSMGTVGDAYDNAMAESFFATLECELIDRRSWKTKQQARLEIFTWIETWYNPCRRHSALNYLSPINFERKFSQNQPDNIQ